MSDHLDKYDELLSLLNDKVTIDGKEYSLKDDFEKFFVRGNKTAGVRIRKFMQLIRRKSEEIRESVQEYKTSL